MDYEKIVKGRRRNWDALKPDDVRQQEKEAEKDQRRKERDERDAVRGMSRERLRQRLKDEASDEDKVAFRRAKSQAFVVVGIFLVAIVVVIGVERFLTWRTRQRYVESLATYEKVILDGKTVSDPSTPVGALATWRSLWVEGNMEGLVDMYSRRNIDRLSRTKNRDDVKAEYRRLHDRGAFESQAELASSFDGAEILIAPKPPWKDDQLAVFRSPAIQRIDDQGPPRVFVASFSWSEQIKKWRFADLREEPYFSIRWTHEGLISPLRVGPNAVKYDAKGRPIYARPNKD